MCLHLSSISLLAASCRSFEGKQVFVYHRWLYYCCCTPWIHTPKIGNLYYEDSSRSAVIEPSWHFPFSLLIVCMLYLYAAVLHKLIASGELCGCLRGHGDKALYVPDVYIRMQNKWSDSFLSSNGYLGRHKCWYSVCLSFIIKAVPYIANVHGVLTCPLVLARAKPNSRTEYFPISPSQSCNLLHELECDMARYFTSVL